MLAHFISSWSFVGISDKFVSMILQVTSHYNDLNIYILLQPGNRHVTLNSKSLFKLQ